MGAIELYRDGDHVNTLLDDATGIGLAVQANHHLIAHGKTGIILDPGGHKVFTQIFGDISNYLGGGELKYLFLSHQDPDIIAATNGWLMVTDADAYVSALWIRFVPHFGVDALVEDRLKPIPDEGMWLDLEGAQLMVLPAHFLHACGNFQIYDPIAKILYSGDLGASLGTDYREVPDFDSHVPYMEGFHQRYMVSNVAMKRWAKMVRQLDLEIIAPQHGALFRGEEMVNRFIDWCDGLPCGLDLNADVYQLPPKP
ncbi:MAG: MBL fold metallo-hydrolase [Proteobacteria bacterium]|nr:MAG: MBL fold metallo-hydrolase [Pseudomonadota bacterium]